MPKEKNLLREVESLKLEIKKLKSRKKYGLVWEEKPEAVVELCKEKLPVFVEDTKKAIETDKEKPVNVLIEGDNYHALSVLNYTHKGKIDFIYIDPPYNTGNRDFIYNDRYVDYEDTYRHSKWLSFMSKRLKLAKELLKDDGVLFVSIDDNEIAQLKLLLDDPDIFGEKRFITNIVVQMSTVQGEKVRSAKRGNIVKNKEYILVYSKNKNKSVFKNPLYDPTPYDSHYSFFLAEKKKGVYEPLQIFDVIKENKTLLNLLRLNGLLSKKKDKEFLPIKNISIAYNLIPLFKEFIDKNANFICRRHDVIEIDKNKIAKDVFKNKVVEYKSKERSYLVGYYNNNFYQVINLSEKIRKANDFYETYGMTTLRGDWWEGFYLDMGNISKEGGVDFENGKKPVRLIKQLLYGNTAKDAVVLDFFAGSGTTGEAVLKLNKEDNGNRRFILCTSNEENDICIKKCYPRIKNSIKGYSGREKLGGNLKYYKTAFVEAEQTDLNKKKLVDKSTEMLCLKEDCFGQIRRTKTYSIFTNNQNKYLGIIYDDAGIAPFKKEAEKIGKKFIVYVFFWDDSAREEEFEDIKKLVELKPIPAVILNVYKRIFK